ncbi:MAG: family hydrolase [Candidatus Saccharibacteria bacterium]|nr:family hydrolase [Candidatus Saccharibacteria bacterium]
MKLKAVVFDFDGTLLNTFEHIVRAFEVVLPKYGVKPDREAIRRVIGMTLIDCYKTLVPNGDHEAMKKLHHETQQTPEMYELILAYDNLRETLETLREQGIKLAVQTNRGRKSVDLIFAHIGLADLFDYVMTADEIDNPKPDPKGLIFIAKEFSIKTSEMVMVGDMPIDVKTGQNAGVAAIIGMTHGFGTRAELESAGASYILDSFAGLPSVITRLQEKK